MTMSKIFIAKITSWFVAGLISTVLAAENPADLTDRIAAAKKNPYSKEITSPVLKNALFAKDNFDSDFSARVFNWNNSNIKHIPLNKAQFLGSQYLSGLNSYFTKVAHLHGANKRSISDATKAL